MLKSARRRTNRKDWHRALHATSRSGFWRRAGFPEKQGRSNCTLVLRSAAATSKSQHSQGLASLFVQIAPNFGLKMSWDQLYSATGGCEGYLRERLQLSFIINLSHLAAHVRLKGRLHPCILGSLALERYTGRVDRISAEPFDILRFSKVDPACST